MKTKRPLIFYVFLLASVIIHCLLFVIVSFKTSQANDSGAGKETERYMSLFNISLLEPLSEVKPVLSSSAAIPDMVSDELLAENFIVIDEYPQLTEMVSETAIRAEMNSDAAARTAEYAGRNYSYIQRRIGAKLVYPPQARRAGIQGVTELVFTIHEDGSVSGVKVRASSGHAILDEAAAAAVFAAAPFPKPNSQTRIAIPISFKLR
jgi:protein TonB